MITDLPIWGERLVISDSATIEFHQFLENLTQEINDILDGTAAVGGAWEQISETTPTAANTVSITFDETLYTAVRLEFEELQVATDSIYLAVRLGSADGGTIYNSTGDYIGMFDDMAGTWSAIADTSMVVITPSSVGNAAGEYLSGSVEVKNFASVNQGGTITADVLYHNTTGQQAHRWAKGALDQQEAAIDTIQLLLESGNFVATGTIKLYGLKV